MEAPDGATLWFHRPFPVNPSGDPPLSEFLLFFVSLFSIVNPFSAIPAFVGLTVDLPVRERNRVTRQASVAVFIILTVSYLAGESLLGFFGISVASLRVAGGMLVLGMAWSMLQAKMSPAKQTPEEQLEAEAAQEGAERPNIGVVPVGMPLLAGPGSISVMIIAAGRTDTMTGHVAVLGAAAVVAFLAFLILLAAGPIAKGLGKTGMNIATRFMGLILAAIAVEFITSGLGEIFPGWTAGGGP
jgi:multiple antibiotic resistance protein